MTLSSPDDANGTRRTAQLLWGIAALMAATGIGALALSGLRVDFSRNPALVAAAVGYGALAWFYHSLRHDARLSTGLETTGQMLLIMLLGIVISYPAAVTALPYRDAELYAIDQWLGFDRRAYVDLVGH